MIIEGLYLHCRALELVEMRDVIRHVVVGSVARREEVEGGPNDNLRLGWLRKETVEVRLWRSKV